MNRSIALFALTLVSLGFSGCAATTSTASLTEECGKDSEYKARVAIPTNFKYRWDFKLIGLWGWDELVVASGQSVFRIANGGAEYDLVLGIADVTEISGSYVAGDHFYSVAADPVEAVQELLERLRAQRSHAWQVIKTSHSHDPEKPGEAAKRFIVLERVDRKGEKGGEVQVDASREEFFTLQNCWGNNLEHLHRFAFVSTAETPTGAWLDLYELTLEGDDCVLNE